MTDFANEIQTRIAALDDRVNRLRAETEAAEKERSDLQIALRVYADVTGGAAPALARKREPSAEAATSEAASSAPQRPSGEKKQLIRQLLGFGEATGKSPATVFKQLMAQGVTDIPITQVRTILWRMENKKQGVGSRDGRYFLTAPESAQPELSMIG
jgi:hypothetical protein